MVFKKSLLITLLSFGIANDTFAETDEEKFSRAKQYYNQQNYEVAISLYEELAERGHLKAEDIIISHYLFGRDYKKLFYWATKSAERGDPLRQSLLGLMYERGDGVAQDDKQAAYWYQKAAEQGNVLDQFKIASMYYNGQGVAKDDKQAVYWYQKAAENGYSDAQIETAQMLLEGKGVRRNENAAVDWLTKAVEQKNANALFKLGKYYQEGTITALGQDYHQALKYFNQAAEQKHDKAQFELGVQYENGWGVRVDKAKAKEWFGKACDDGSQAGCDKYKKLTESEK